MKAWVKPLVIAALAILPLSCGAGDSASAGGSEDGARRIAVIPKGMTHEFWKTVQAGAESAGAELGVEVVWDGPGKESDRAEQIKIVEKSIPRVDAIAIAPLDAEALAKPLREAHGAGKPVLIFDSGLRGWEDYVSFVATDNFAAGEMAADELARLIGGKGKVLVLRYAVGHESTTNREDGFLKKIADYPDIEVVASDQYGGEGKQACQETAERLMVRYSDVDGCFAPCEPVTIGLMKAIGGVGKSGEIRLVGFDSSEELKDGLGAGTIDALMLQDPYRMGELAVQRMVDHLDGRPVDKRIDTGCVVATKDNMADAAVDRLLYGG
ncbi:MAG: substrate-binding domain-containing protein [Planctomycetota bacterium]